MAYVYIGDLRIYVEEQGTGEPLVLMHGAGSAIDDIEGSWTGLTGLFSQYFRTVSIEHRGHGRSNNPNNLFDYSTLATDVLDVASKLGLGAFHFAGVSDGAIVGLHIGMHNPKIVRSLVLLGVNYCNDAQTVEANRTWANFPIEADDSPRARAYSDRHDRAGKPSGSWRALFQGLADNVALQPSYTTDDLALIEAPVLLVAGENDGYANRDQLMTMRDCIGRSELCIVNNAGHTVQYSHPHIVGAVTVDFLLRHCNHGSAKSTNLGAGEKGSNRS